MVKLSIIIPVYNDSKLIHKSIASILSQTFDDLEIICIDDGSIDNSLEILNNYAKQYDYIKVFTQENQGPAIARNNGILKSSGEYIGFLDADDYFISNLALEKLYETAIKNDANVVSGNIKLVNEHGFHYPFTSLEYYTEYKKISPEDYGIPWGFYKNIYKRKFLIENHINFPDLIRGEDPVFLAHVLSVVDKIYTVPVDVYAYFYIDGFSKVNSERKYYDHILHYKKVFDYLNDEKFKEIIYKFKKEMTNFIRLMGVENAERLIKITQDIFKNDTEILMLCEDYFYYSFKEYPNLTKLVDLNNSDKIRISIIMPNNNFKESIHSVLNQTFSNYELICYNNHNIESSYLYELSKLYPKIIINKNICTIGDALNIARGDYIYFFNPKGILIENALEELYKNAVYNNSEIVLFKLAKTLKDKKIDYYQPIYNIDDIFTDKNFDNFTFNYKTISGHILYSIFVPWSKLYKKEFLNQNSDLKLNCIDCEDMLFDIKTIFKAKHISFSPDFYYIYQGFQYTKNYYDKNIIETIEYIECFLRDNKYFDEMEFEFYKFKIERLSNAILPSMSEEFLMKVKNIFARINSEIINELPYFILKKYFWTMYSSNLKNYESKTKVDNDLISSLEEFNLTYQNLKLITTNEKLTKNNKKLTKNNNKLKKENKQLKNKNKKLNKTNKEIISSNSWKLTKPLRKIKHH